jgi:leucyl aminopeptidase
MWLRKTGRTECRVALEAWPQFAGAVVEGLVLGGYRFERFKTKQTPELARATLQVAPRDLAEAKRAAARGHTIAEATNLARAIGNEPGNLLYPATLADRARKLAKEARLSITVLDEKQLRARKFGGLLAVGGGSPRGPRLIVLHHRGGPKTQPPIALVGKAITFDSGGISIKPAADMEEMIFDKCGGMAVLGAMAGLARLGVKRNVVGVIASAENLPSGTAYRPGDIVTTYDGKHIEIVNTDAEGRVVLADAIAYARKDCRAAAIVDLATLTGACGVALGEYAAGFWSSDDTLKASVLAAAERAGERLWPMPLHQEYSDQIKSDVALIKNSGGRLGGACTAAAFLKTFAEDTPWAHLDIAYTAHRKKDTADLARGASGFGVRTLIELACRGGL